jgi:hypothetical protein
MACNGNYEVGSDLATGTDAPCRLTLPERNRAARRYWELAPLLFRQDAITTPQRPCPFADRRNQLMRNLAFAAAWAERGGLSEFGMVLAYVGRAPRAAETRDVYERFKSMLLPAAATCVGVITYEEIAAVLRATGDPDDADLARWIDRRIDDGLASAQG